MPDVLVPDQLVASAGLDCDMAAAKEHGRSVVIYADEGRIVVLVWQAEPRGDAYLLLSHPSVAAARAEGLGAVHPDCYWRGVGYVESDMQADCWTQSEDRAGLAREYRTWGAV